MGGQPGNYVNIIHRALSKARSANEYYYSRCALYEYLIVTKICDIHAPSSRTHDYITKPHIRQLSARKAMHYFMIKG